jgi:hypothetical protein
VTQIQAAIWRPYAAKKEYRGKSLSEWGVAWKLWGFAPTSCDDAPAFDVDGSLCGEYQDPDSPVFFLDFSASDAPRTRCRVPQGKALVVPLITFFNDKAGMDPPKTDDELLASVEDAFESMRDLRLRADGVSIHNLDEYGFGPTRYSYSLPPAPNWYSCNGVDNVSDTVVDPSFLAGFIAVMPPPEPGEHRLEYGGVLTFEGNDYALAGDTTFVVEAERNE